MRSLFVVGSPTPSSIAVALDGPADGLLIDLEDSVHPGRKADFREGVIQTLPALASASKTFLVRINDVMTETGRTDLVRLVEAGAVNILLPKVRTAAEFQQADALIRRAETDVVRRVGATRLWAMAESTECILNLKEIGTAPRVAGFVFGAGDLSAELGVRQLGLGASRPVWDYPVELLYHKQFIVLVARSNGLQAIDSGYSSAGDQEGTHRSALMSAQLGFDGTMAHAPGQIQAIHRAFTPSETEYAAARRGLDAIADAYQRGETKAVVDGERFGGPFTRAARGLVNRFERYGRSD